MIEIDPTALEALEKYRADWLNRLEYFKTTKLTPKLFKTIAALPGWNVATYANKAASFDPVELDLWARYWLDQALHMHICGVWNQVFDSMRYAHGSDYSIGIADLTKVGLIASLKQKYP